MSEPTPERVYRLDEDAILGEGVTLGGYGLLAEGEEKPSVEAEFSLICDCGKVLFTRTVRRDEPKGGGQVTCEQCGQAWFYQAPKMMDPRRLPYLEVRHVGGALELLREENAALRQWQAEASPFLRNYVNDSVIFVGVLGRWQCTQCHAEHRRKVELVHETDCETRQARALLAGGQG